MSMLLCPHTLAESRSLKLAWAGSIPAGGTMTKEEQKTARVIVKIAKLFKNSGLSDQDTTTLLISAIIKTAKRDSNGKIQLCSKKRG